MTNTISLKFLFPLFRIQFLAPSPKNKLEHVQNSAPKNIFRDNYTMPRGFSSLIAVSKKKN